MAVYTDVSDEALTAFLALYDVGAAQSFKGIAEGVENSNFLLATDRGRFVLTIYEKRVDPADLPFFMTLMDHAAARGAPAPLPVRARDGSPLQRLGDKWAALITFLDGLSPRKPDAQHCHAAGAGLAQLHLAWRDVDLSRPNALGAAHWAGLFAGREAQAEQLQEGLAMDIVADLGELAVSWPQGLPRGVIHADLFPDNVLFTGHQVSGLIDFYFSCTDLLAYDLAIMLNAWAFEQEPGGRVAYNHTKGAALIGGYHAVRPLLDAERAALPILARGAALRFFLTRLIDWYRPTDGALVRKKDPLDYAGRLRFHRAAQGPSDYGA